MHRDQACSQLHILSKPQLNTTTHVVKGANDPRPYSGCGKNLQITNDGAGPVDLTDKPAMDSETAS